MLKLTLQREEVKSAKQALKTTGKHLLGVLQGQFYASNFN